MPTRSIGPFRPIILVFRHIVFNRKRYKLLFTLLREIRQRGITYEVSLVLYFWHWLYNLDSSWQARGALGCTLGCSDFDFFHILRYNHPSLTSYGSKDLEIGKKNLLFHAWPAEIFGMRFFWYDFKV
jgi:hypothetical protein